MVTNTEAYKGRKFTCAKCDYVVSSDATDDFSVEDFQFCPYCGNSATEEVPAAKQQTNADRIRNMTDAELAEWIYSHDTKAFEKGRWSKERILEYMQAEVKE